MFKKILAATQHPTFCDEIVQTAASLAALYDAQFHILHALESDATIYRNFVRHFKTGEEIVANASYEKAVQEEIEKHCAPYVNAFTIKITQGYPWEEIVKYQRRKAIDLIVLGPHEKNGPSHAGQKNHGRFGSTTEGVIKHAHCPLMLVNGPVAKKKLYFKRILTAVDYSPSCGCALRVASRLAEACGASLHVLSMQLFPRNDMSENLCSDPQAAKVELERFCLEVDSTLKAQYWVVAGERPHLEILRFARDKDVDVIAMGSHTKKEHDGTWRTGSVAELVGARSNCPVLVATDPRAVAGLQKSVSQKSKAGI